MAETTDERMCRLSPTDDCGIAVTTMGCWCGGLASTKTPVVSKDVGQSRLRGVDSRAMTATIRIHVLKETCEVGECRKRPNAG